mgnify:CR=1 FL=1
MENILDPHSMKVLMFRKGLCNSKEKQSKLRRRLLSNYKFIWIPTENKQTNNTLMSFIVVFSFLNLKFVIQNTISHCEASNIKTVLEKYSAFW